MFLRHANHIKHRQPGHGGLLGLCRLYQGHVVFVANLFDVFFVVLFGTGQGTQSGSGSSTDGGTGTGVTQSTTGQRTHTRSKQTTTDGPTAGVAHTSTSGA